MVGIVIVSHSEKAALGIVELSMQMGSEDQKVIAAGGLEDGTIGTDAARIASAIEAADEGDGVVVLADLGSAVLSTSLALELVDGSLSSRVKVADAPILEGAVAAVVSAAIDSTLDEVVAAAEEARELHKSID